MKTLIINKDPKKKYFDEEAIKENIETIIANLQILENENKQMIDEQSKLIFFRK
jgi:hypothetical protein